VKTAKSRRIIWAVDPSSGDVKLQLRTLKAITALWRGGDVSIEPVCVMSPDQGVRAPRGVPAAGAGGWLTTQKTVQRWIAGAGEPSVLAPTVLLQDRHSLSNSVETLLRYARDTRARVIAVSTHARTRLVRLALGSFAETLLLRSEIPMLVVNPDVADAKAGPLRRLLFPTDFSEGSRRAFREMLPLAKRNSARVTLFYQFEYLAPGTAGQIHTSAIHRQFFERDVAAKRRKAESWAAVAMRAGVSVDVAISQEPGFVPDAILAMAARTRAGLIAMASQSGAVAATLLGSVVRRVVREAQCPVWVIHPCPGPRARKGARRESSRPSR
jgi:nucleotide-binding universal stress UspA family protein